MTRFGGKQDLSKAQILERSRHRQEAVKMKGLPTPAGTPPREYRPVERPWFIRIPNPATGIGDILRRLKGGLKWRSS